MDHHLFQPSLAGSPLHNLLVKGVGSDQTIHHDRLGLPNTVAAILGLEITLGVLGGEDKSEEEER